MIHYEQFLGGMGLWWAIILLPVGLTVLIKGADWLVDGAVAVAKHLGMSPLIIGLTIVAMGTSAPEVAGKACPGLHQKFPTREPPLWRGVPKPERIILHETDQYSSMAPDLHDRIITHRFLPEAP